jgi:hypothetical protein
MDAIPDRITRLESGIQRGAEWLRTNLPFTAGKSYTSGKPGDNGPIHSGCYMLTAYAYQKAGFADEAFDMLSYVADEIAGTDGEGCVSQATVEAGSFIPYAPAWHTFTLARLGRPDLARKVIRHVVAWQHRGEYGGFFDGQRQRDLADGVFCFDGSSASICACLHAGELEAARRGGAYLLRLDELSTETTRLWTIRPDGSPVYSKDDPAFALHSATPDQVMVVCSSGLHDTHIPHWKTGFYVACCTYLYQAFDDMRYLAAAKRCARWAARTDDSKSGHRLWAHKLAWGMAELYKVTRDEEHLNLASELGEMLLRRQDAKGTFPYTEWFPDVEPTKITYSICAQGVIWMAFVKEALQLHERDAKRRSEARGRPRSKL